MGSPLLSREEATELQTLRNPRVRKYKDSLRNPRVQKVSVNIEYEERMTEVSTKACLIIGGTLFTLVLAIAIACIADSVHTVDEGTVGVYYKYGALNDKISHPGVAWKQPFVTTVEQVTIRPRTDVLDPVNAVTKDGINMVFKDIQILTDVQENNIVELIRKFGKDFRKALVFDRVREEVRLFSAGHNIDEVYNTKFMEMVNVVKTETERNIKRLSESSVEILNLVIPKPEIPDDIAANYKRVKVQWTEQLVATQQQKTEKIKKETESMLAVQDAERQKKVLEIDIQKDILRKEGENSLADVEAYKKLKQAEANKELYSEQYIRLEMAKALSNNTKFFFSGETSVLGGLLQKVMGSP